MLLPIIGIMGASAVGANPFLVGVPHVESTNSGLCGTGAHQGQVVVDAALRVSWSITNPDGSVYSAKLYENGVLVSTQDSAASMTWDKTITGYVENGVLSPFDANWTYRVDIVRKADGVVIYTSKPSAAWSQSYGKCAMTGGL